MRVLLVEPKYRRDPLKWPVSGKVEVPRRSLNDEQLWYPSVGLMKLSRFHKERGDEVRFVSGCDPPVFSRGDLFTPAELWDRVYITSVFTYHFKEVVKTIRFYLDAVGGTVSKIFVGGVMASMMPDDIFEETGVYPILGVINSARQIDIPDDTNIDLLPPDYNLLDGDRYAINSTYYLFATKGCTRSCSWCAVPKIEPTFASYIDVKPIIRQLREEYGDKPTLKLMDNNILASPNLEQIVDDLLELGYGKGEYVATPRKKQRVVDFNQGIDCRYINESNMRLISVLNIEPMRIAFDMLGIKKQYVQALELGHKFGVHKFSNYMLYNYRDTPRDLYERLTINIELNEQWKLKGTDTQKNGTNGVSSGIYSYPMRFAPIDSKNGDKANRKRDHLRVDIREGRDWAEKPIWTPRFTRNIEIMKGAANGAISPTPTLARRTIGGTFQEFLSNLYMPEELIRNRNKHEKNVFDGEPKRPPGTGLIEDFRGFIFGLLERQDDKFQTFHDAVSSNRSDTVRKYIQKTEDPELVKWLKLYLKS